MKTKVKVYHNPRCGKSRDCLVFLDNAKYEFEIIKYLENPISKEELTSILSKLKIKPIELVRVKEKIWIENYKNKSLSNNEIIDAMINNPILIERPIVVNGDKAAIGRPLKKIQEILS